MVYELLLSRIQELWDAASARNGKKISERQLCLRAGVGVKTLVSIRLGHAPKPLALGRLADYLKAPRDYLLTAAGEGGAQPMLQPLGALETIFIKGAVQAGLWMPAMEWQPDEWYSVQVPVSRRFPGLPRYGLEVRGDSMNLVFTEGTIILSIKFFEMERAPESGDRVVVYRRDGQTGDFEATVKEYERDQRGRHILWPRSSNPEFQTPIVLGEGNFRVAPQEAASVTHVTAGATFHGAGLDDVEVWALVVGAYTEI